ncbi:MAG: DNA polymerase I, partial [Clostridia bacterium]|nr:DNA polymerase I [Clostridia bacterium]
MEKLVLIDGNSLLNRAFYATPLFTTKDGLPTNAVFGFIKLMLKIVADKKPTHFAVAFDVHAPTFRHQLYGEYKAGRKPMPQELAVQIPILKEVLSLMQICVVEKAGYEADDLIGTLAKRFDLTTFIYTGDRDAYQLVDETTHVCFTRKGVSDILELTAENFKDEIGLTPAQIIDLKALMGDKSDNIPGVPGIGEKTAHTLLEKYGNVEELYRSLEEISGATYQKLSQNKEQAFFSRKLA